ncbi:MULTISPECIES: peptidoglycan-binding domain-containing protein [Sorangium]|uniref:Peptidoglycan binding-like domain-containing protein n=1 Tax=Sorangium cellulosum (strain So ce56) TaxID=448385 RepID=A9GTV2_SORC5|nr:peptidoglycan-binding domain-containing protein [Sorangium cellulosum]CAN96998.1 hypothetical protein predicted by Glimmer/Critica [Sorangium cellulosum So ce56]
MNPSTGGPTSQAFFQANTSAGGFGTVPLQGTTTPCPPVTKKALEVTVVERIGEGVRPLGDHLIELSRGQARYRLPSSAFGPARFEGLDSVTHGLTLVGIDQDAWDVMISEGLPEQNITSNLSPDWRPPEEAQLGGGEHTVQPGEGVDKLALRFGHLPEILWGYEPNAPLRGARESRNTLHPGDKLHVPPRRPKQIDVVPGHHYVLVRKGTMSRLRLRIEVAFEPLDMARYLLEIPNFPTLSGPTVNGYIDVAVPASTSAVRVTIDGLPRPIQLRLETLLPLRSDAGVQQRLHNLGMPCGRTDGTMDDQASAVLRRFQQMVKQAPTGAIDNNVRAALWNLHDRG